MDLELERNKIQDIIKPYEEVASKEDILVDEKTAEGKQIVKDATDKFQIQHDTKQDRIKELEEELEKLKEEKQSIVKRNNLKIEDLKEKKEQEINEYIETSLANNGNFYSGYEARIREDLENEFSNKIKELEDEPSKLDEKIEEIELEIQNLKASSKEQQYSYGKYIEHLKGKTNDSIEDIHADFKKYSNVELRLRAYKKDEIRKELILARENLNTELISLKISYNEALASLEDYNTTELEHKYRDAKIQLAQFKLEEQEENVFTNVADFKMTFDHKSQIEFELEMMKKQRKAKEKSANEILEQIKEYESLIKDYEEAIDKMKYTQEESNALIRSLTPWEKEELDRRMNLNNEEQTAETENEMEDISSESGMDTENQMEDIYSDSSMLNQLGSRKEYESIQEVFAEVLDTIKSNVDKMKKIKLQDQSLEVGEQEIEIDNSKLHLPSGIYLGAEDLLNATNAFINKYENGDYPHVTYAVKGIKKGVEITEKKLKQFKNMISEASSISLMGNSKKDGLNSILGVSSSRKAVEKIASENYDEKYEGDYISAKDLLNNFDLIFAENKQKWSDKIISKLSEIKSRVKNSEILNPSNNNESSILEDNMDNDDNILDVEYYPKAK